MEHPAFQPGLAAERLPPPVVSYLAVADCNIQERDADHSAFKTFSYVSGQRTGFMPAGLAVMKKGAPYYRGGEPTEVGYNREKAFK